MGSSDVLSGTGVVGGGTSLSIQIIHDRRQVRLVPIGEIDVHSVSTFVVAGGFAVEELPEHIHIDLTQVTFIDSGGVRGIESVVAAARDAGVPCSIVGRGMDLSGDDSVARPMVLWSGSTTRLIAVPMPEA
jgi:anti-anti-sigma regulatory factor